MKVLLILDSIQYKKKEKAIKKIIDPICDSKFIYTDYENFTIKFFHRVPMLGNLMSHIIYWSISLYAAIKILYSKKEEFKKKVFINPIVGFFYCFLLEIFYLKDNVYLSGLLFVPKTNKFYFWIRKKLVLFLFKM